MPSDDRVEQALEAVGEDRAAFRSAVAGAVDEVRSLLERQRAPAQENRGPGDPSLGRLAEGRIDVERFASLVEEPGGLDPEAVDLVERSREVLVEVHRAGTDAFLLDLDAGEDLRDAVASAQARIGRAFGAARIVELARSDRYRSDAHEGYLESFPPAMWNGGERGVAPPLVVRLRGADLRPSGLGDFLDGSMKLLLVVEGDAPPASLVRLITPGTLVLQATDPAALEPVGGHDGTAVVALFPGGTDDVARFVHDPTREGPLQARFSAEHLPDEADLRPVGPTTRAQQAEELGQLRSLALAAEASPASENGRPPDRGEEPGGDPADRLAGWLLRQSGLEDLEG